MIDESDRPEVEAPQYAMRLPGSFSSYAVYVPDPRVSASHLEEYTLRLEFNLGALASDTAIRGGSLIRQELEDQVGLPGHLSVSIDASDRTYPAEI